MLDLLPTEVLQLVTGHLNGLYIGLLWLCGNTRLNKRMGDERGVLHFEIYSKFCAWPSLVCNFRHLESFRFIPMLSPLSSSFWQPESENYQDLSPTLKSLDLTGLREPASFLRIVFRGELYFPNLTTLKSENMRCKLPGKHLEAWLKAMPSIERLTFYQLVLTELSPVSLPSRLKELKISVEHLDLSAGVQFPESLESLDLTFNNYSEDNPWIWFSGLPVGLTELSLYEIGIEDYYYPPAKDIALLPHSLKSFCIEFDEQVPTVDFVQALPPNLTNLSLWIKVDIAPTWWEDNDYAVIKALPRTLQSIAHAPEPTQESAKYFPPGLVCDSPWVAWDKTDRKHTAKTVTIASAPLDEVLRATKLPDSVTSIITYSSDYINLHMLPTSLTYLKLEIDERWTPIERFEHLPKSLRFLEISARGPHVAFPFERLPSHIDALTLCRASADLTVTIEDCGALPRNLRSLKLFHVGFENPATAWSLLPPRLEELVITDLALPLGCAEALPKMDLEKLSLKFSEDTSQQLSHHILKTLPLSLTSCVLWDKSPGIGSISAGSIDDLPPGLTLLEIGLPLKISRETLMSLEDIFTTGPTRLEAPRY